MNAPAPPPLTTAGRSLVLAASFLGWLCAGVQMGLGTLLNRPALRDLIPDVEEKTVGLWFGRLLASFLLGAAFGGLLFGRLGDRIGRVRAMALSIGCYSLFSGAAWFARSPLDLLILRFLAGLGIGGMWPCGVALASEAWPSASKAFVAGVMGAGANVGILLMAILGGHLGVSPETWRDVSIVAGTPALLAVFVALAVPESPRWLASLGQAKGREPLGEVFRPPLLSRTVLGVLLGTVPLIGAWSSSKWMIPWAEASGADPARTQAVWAAGAVAGSAVGGWLAVTCGRRLMYFVISLLTVGVNLIIYRWLDPVSEAFLPTVFAQGVIATTFFGWLPLYLPELFPTRVRATGTGIAFNFGRFASAAGALGAGVLMTYFDGDYSRVGEVTALVYGLGAVVILFAPDTRRQPLD